MKNYIPVIGLEVHVELKTKSKMFCGCDANYFGKEPNTHTCPVCLGLPGALPVPNRLAIEWCIKIGLALHCEIPLFSKFDRKNYFYPDLAKGYQISQYDQPLAQNGWIEISSTASNTADGQRILKQVQNDRMKRIGIRRVHMEEDTGKLMHAAVNGENVTLVDFNRSGVPLVEIVTEPDIHSSEEARIYLKRLQQIIRYLDVSDADMEKGSMRLEPNISLATEEFSIRSAHSNNNSSSSRVEKLPSYKVEVKNINSFGFVKKAIDYEVVRHTELLNKGETPVQETRGWDEKKNATVSQRRKEEAHDYRYFPEPDIPPMQWTQEFITKLKSDLPELPQTKLDRFVKQYALPLQDAARLTETQELADYFEAGIKKHELSIKETQISPKNVANYILNKNINISEISFEELLTAVQQTKTKVAVDPVALERIITQVLAAQSKAVADYKSGKTGVIMFLVGMVMKELKGQGDATQIKSLLEEKLK